MSENTDSFTPIPPPPDFDFSDLPRPKPRGKPWTPCSLALDVSGRCNLRCAYCAESATLPKRKPMSRRVLERSLRFLYEKISPGQTPAVRFGSGEPLLAPRLLEEAARLSKGLSEQYGYPPPQFFVTTNATLLDRESLKLLSAPGWRVKVSLDGPPDVHDACRQDANGRGTSQKALGAIEKLLDAIGGRLSVTAVLSPGTDPAEVFEFCESLHIEQIELLPAAAKPGRKTFTDGDLQRYRSFVAGYARDLTRGRPRKTLSRFCNLIPRVMGYAVQSYRCGAGRSLYAAGPDGGLYPCFRMIGISDFRVGSVFSDFAEEPLLRFRKTTGCSYLRRSACSACWARSLCNGPCFALAGLMNLAPGRGSVQCAYSRMDAAEAVRLVSRMQKTDPRKLLIYLPADGASSCGRPQANPDSAGFPP